ncbi:MAG TPA: UvrD-helicase domain-containing protein [Marmoricola sp.]
MSDSLTAREIAHEQEFVDGVYRQLAASTESASALAKEGLARGHLGHEGGLVERDAMVYQAAKRLATLDSAHEGLVFGRLDLRPDVDDQPRYIGRIGLRDANHDVLLIDWRAPAAAVFYQATQADPMNVIRRRILRSRGETVIGVEDDLLDATAETELPIIGEGALMAQLSRARDRSMHSIVATIQAEQDRAIRAPQKGVVSITGGPGTGKTVVALHRAAFLLYADRRKYERGGVLVVGPSGVFMRYIERVLPSLGETAVALRSLGEVVDGVRATRRDDPAVAEIKGSRAMVELMRRTARQAVPGAPERYELFYRDSRIVLGPRELGQVRRQLLSMGRRNRSTAKVATTLIDVMWRQVGSERALERTKEDFRDEVRTDDAFLEFAAAWWPVLDASTVLSWLREPEFLGRVAQDVLDEETVRLLAKSWGDDLSVDDVALLDELRYLIGDPPLGGDEDEDPLGIADASLQEIRTVDDREQLGPRDWTPPTHRVEDDPYAHVLIDEAQDLTPMQWRMVGRRGRTATWTIVGDPAQSSWPIPEEAAAARAEALGEKQVHAFHLSKNYRNSSEIYDYAAAYARRVGLDADLPEAVRSTGVEPEERRVADLEVGIDDALSALHDSVDGTIGIVVPLARRSGVQQWLSASRWADDAAGDDARIVVLTGLDTKGLEFDGIVVAQPQEIEDESPTGRATLYVVLTRATQRLIVLSQVTYR